MNLHADSSRHNRQLSGSSSQSTATESVAQLSVAPTELHAFFIRLDYDHLFLTLSPSRLAHLGASPQDYREAGCEKISDFLAFMTPWDTVWENVVAENSAGNEEEEMARMAEQQPNKTQESTEALRGIQHLTITHSCLGENYQEYDSPPYYGKMAIKTFDSSLPSLESLTFVATNCDLVNLPAETAALNYDKMVRVPRNKKDMRKEMSPHEINTSDALAFWYCKLMEKKIVRLGGNSQTEDIDNQDNKAWDLYLGVIYY
jgi:hypothetical protein